MEEEGQMEGEEEEELEETETESKSLTREKLIEKYHVSVALCQSHLHCLKGKKIVIMFILQQGW